MMSHGKMGLECSVNNLDTSKLAYTQPSKFVSLLLSKYLTNVSSLSTRGC